MVLHHVAQCTGAFVIACAIFQPDRLGNGDLHIVDAVRVPDRLEEEIPETQRQDVLDGFLAEIMVDAEGSLLREAEGDRVVDLLG